MGTFPPDERDDPLPGLRVAITGGTSVLGLALARELAGAIAAALPRRAVTGGVS